MAEKPRKSSQIQDLRNQINSLRQLSTELNSLSEELNRTVQSVEYFLNDTCSLGIATSVPVDLDINQDPSGSRRIKLEYRRVGSKFRIAVVEDVELDTGDDEESVRESVRPWSDCSRDEKLITFRKLPDLLAKLAEEIQKRIKEALEALEIRQAIKPLLEGIKEVEPMGPPEDDIPSDDIPF